MGARSWSTASPSPPSLAAGPCNSSCGGTPPLSPRPPAPSSCAQTHPITIDLPPCLALPDGEERPYGSSTRLRIRDYDQESEIYRECIRPPPNRSVLDSGESALAFRCKSVGILPVANPKNSCGILCWRGCQKEKLDPRLVLDANGQPVVMRSKSMSTGSSHTTCPHETTAAPLSVMVPISRPAPSSSSALMSLPTTRCKPQVQSPCGHITFQQQTDKHSAGVANAAFESCASSSSCTSSTEKLANLPVVSCAAVSSTTVSTMNS